ncbi:DUF3798 domain-containing protein [Clostridium sp. CF012]|uniref:DUF3798 domain-containing protein n=1 Tax=Clostridium sp. CF012 TaxID=2843319 RepID=UPI001C0AF76A|nr:DUF3798 domain-containing protein [Clostridium sp. CF012]MBU3143278.1 DUF3798 domain-containing protein [Clostridium sp. CF012]
MLKKSLAIGLSLMLTFGMVGCARKTPTTTPETKTPAVTEAKKMHIGIVTGTVSQGEDDLRGAEAMIKKYGDAASGGMIKHVTYPDNFTQELETTISTITGLADDADMKVIVVNQAVPGTVAAFTQIREKRPDILLLANSSQEDTAMIEAVSDLVVDPDNVNRGYLMILAAKKMGAKTFVHISFPRHMSIELLSLRKNIMEQACKDLGIKFVFETAPDPTSDVGIPGAQQFILEKMPAWVEKYGKDTAFFCTNDAQTEPLLKRVAELGAIFVEPDLPSPVMGYPGAFGIDLKAEAGNWPEILKKVESTVVAKGGSGRMGTWAFSYGYTASEGLVEYGKNVVEGTMKKGNLADVIKAFGLYTPGAEWNGSLYTDRVSNKEISNHIMVYQDTYVFGKGYLGNSKEVVPPVYKTIK